MGGRRRLQPEVSTYDFPEQTQGKAIPYGVDDIADDSAWVSVGVDHDTSVFAVATIKEWWRQMGAQKYPTAQLLLITADGGGSNGHRPVGSQAAPTLSHKQ
jgi:Rhodopirellula transposase DDE domain